MKEQDSLSKTPVRANRYFLLFYIGILLLVAFSLVIYSNRQSKILESQTWKILSEVAEQQQYNFSSIIQAKKAMLRTAAVHLEELPLSETSEEGVALELAKLTRSTDFEGLMIADSNGKGRLPTGEEINLADKPYWRDALKGETTISDPVQSKINGESLLVLSIPLYQNEKIVATLSGAYPVEALETLFMSPFQGTGYGFVINRDGHIVTQLSVGQPPDSSDNFFERLSSSWVMGGDAFEETKRNIQAGISGKTEYASGEDERRLAAYLPIEGTHWTLVSIVPSTVNAQQMDSLDRNTLLLAALNLVLFSCLVLCVYWVLQKNNKRLYEAAYFDKLTGIPNLEYFCMLVGKRMKESTDERALCIQFDVRQFAIINELFGNQTGDRVLKTTAQTVTRLLSEAGCDNALIARISADRFIVFCKQETESDVDAAYLKIPEALIRSMPFLNNYKPELRIGRYQVEPGDTVEELVERVNLAHKLARERNSAVPVDYVSDYKDALLTQSDIRGRMENALEQREFQVYLQGKYHLEDGTLHGAEALVRWEVEEGVVILPGLFIPEFERNGFIVQLDFYMFERSCEILSDWKRRGLPLIPISVNFSRKHLTDSAFAEKLANIVAKYGLPAYYLEIELTETAAIDNEATLAEFMRLLHEKGFLISLDDFGTGYSSLGLIKNLDIDIVKLDRSFFVNAAEERRAFSVVSNMINMTKDLTVATVAEGVETKEQVDILRRLNCDLVQGYYFSKPVPFEAFEELLKRHISVAHPSFAHLHDVAQSKNTAGSIEKRSSLRKNNDLLMTTMDTMPLAFVLWDRRLCIVQCNKACVEMFQFCNEQEFISRFSETLPEYQPDGEHGMSGMIARLQGTLETGFAQFDNIFQLPSGIPVPSEVTMVRIKNRGEQMVVAYIRDMRRQVESENIIKNANLRMQILMDATPLCFNLWNKEMNNTMCNKAAVNLFSLEKEADYLDRFAELSPEYQPDGSLSSEKAAKKVKEAFETGESVFTWMHQKLNGEPIPSEITLTRIQMNGEYMVAGFTRDVRRQLREEKAVMDANERMQVVIDAIPMCINLWDRELNNIMCSATAVKMFELSDHTECIERFFEDLSPAYQENGGESKQMMKQIIRETFESGYAAMTWVHQIPKTKELFPVEVVLKRITVQGEDYVVAFTRDLRDH